MAASAANSASTPRIEFLCIRIPRVLESTVIFCTPRTYAARLQLNIRHTSMNSNYWNDQNSPVMPVSAPDFMPQEQLRELQLHRLKSLVKYTYDRVELFRNRCVERGVRPDAALDAAVAEEFDTVVSVLHERLQAVELQFAQLLLGHEVGRADRHYRGVLVVPVVRIHRSVAYI